MILAFVRTGRVRLSVFQERDESPNEIDERDHEPQDDQRIEDIVANAEHQLLYRQWFCCVCNCRDEEFHKNGIS